ncbi:MAG: LAGLIDADG family homing endonuclease, partial [Chloroflexota bacterium]
MDEKHRFTGATSKGLTFERRWTTPGVHPYDEVEWELRNAKISSESGKSVFEQNDVEVPTSWSQLATNVVVSKYFRGNIGTPGRERSVKQLIDRVVNTITGWAATQRYFASDEDMATFKAELTHLLIHQKMAFNSPVWFNVGVEPQPQCSACFINSVDDSMSSIMDLAKTEAMLFKYGSGAGVNLSTIRGSKEKMSGGGVASGPVSFMKGFDAFAGVVKSGGKTRRAAKMVILDTDHPDVLDFIDSKASEERKAWALIEAGYDASFTGEAYGSVFFQNANHSVRASDDFMLAVETDSDWTTREVRSGDPAGTYKARSIFARMAEAAWICGDPGIQYDTTINDWNPVSNSDRQYATNPCSEFSFLNDTSCFAPETRISTPSGLRTVEELFRAQELGQQVMVTTDLHSEDDHRRVTSHRPARVTQVGERPVFRMRLADGREIRATADHRFLTADGKWKELGDLREGTDHIAIRQSGNPVSFGSDEADVRRWRMLGWMTGDGVFSKDTAALVFGPSERQTAEWMETEFQDLVAEARERAATVDSLEIDLSRGAMLDAEGIHLPARGRASHVSTAPNGVMQISSSSGAAIRMLEDQYGFRQATATRKDVPGEVHRISDDLRVAYLQGLFSADGSIMDSRANPHVMLASSSPSLLRSVQLMLADLGITSRATWTHPTGRKNPQGQLHVTNRQARAFLAIVGFPCSEVKQARATEILGRPFAGARKNPRAPRIMSIEPAGVEMVYDITEPYTHSVIAEGLIAHNCNLASLNLMKFKDADGEFDAEAFRFAARLTITAQEILVDNASYPTPQIEENSHRYRPLGLGYANLGALLMSRGLAYDSDEGRSYAGAITAIMTGEAYRQSAVVARDHGGPFNDYAKNVKPFLRVIRKHRDAAHAAEDGLAPESLVASARKAWDEALELGEQHGYRNAQVSVLAPTGCLVGGSMVLTDRGLVRLRSLGNVDGEKWQPLDLSVATDDGPRTATRFFVNGAEPVVRVKTKRGYRISGTTMHRIKVVDDQGDWRWRRFSDVRAGDRVPLMLGGLVGDKREVPLPPLAEAYWTSDHRSSVPRYMNPDLAELVGYFMGDGSLHAKGLRFCVDDKDPDVVDRLVDHGQRLFGLEAAVSQRKGYTEVALHSVRLTLWWEACGFAKHAPSPGHSGKGHMAHIPDAVLYTNDAAAYQAFVRGLFEADGNTNGGYASWSTVGEQFCDDVQTMLLALGFVTTRKVDLPSEGHFGSNPIHVLRLLNRRAGGAFVQAIGFISERKRNSLQLAGYQQAARHDLVPVSRAAIDRLAAQNDDLRRTMLLSMSRTGMVSRRSATTLLERTSDPELAQSLGYFYDEVASAELGAEELTYDLSVPSNVTYVANGFVSHNTIAFMMDCDTTGIEPDIALIKYKKLVGEGFLKIVNGTVPVALRRLGYTPDEVETIVAYIDERETIEGAPGLKPEHLPVFDCAFKPVNGERTIAHMGHLRMMSATQPFLSGAISKTVNMPESATTQDIEDVYMKGWKLGLKAIAIYRDGSKRSQPLSTGKKKSDDEAADTLTVGEAPGPELTGEPKPYRRRLPDERRAITHKFQVSGHEGYITVGLYPDGQPGEIFLKMAKEGST